MKNPCKRIVRSNDIAFFRLLKREIADRTRASFPGMSVDISEWKGQEIVNFQEELSRRVNEHLSEKWFYTHMKSDREALPRIDTLNLLCRFAGYSDWNDFRHRHGTVTRGRVLSDQSNLVFYLLPLILVLLFGTIYMVIKLSTIREYQFCFVNQLTRKPVVNTRIDAAVLWENQAPEFLHADTCGCFTLRTNRPVATFAVSAPYYRKDTIRVRLDRANRTGTISLRANDYAMMIHYLSNSKLNDWQARREQLDMIFADHAMIYQVLVHENLGMELFNKWEFINKITMPSSGLKNLEIIETSFEADKISALWFRQIDAEHE